MSSPQAEALASLHLIRATLGTLADKGVFTSDDLRQTFEAAIDKCKAAGPTLIRHNEATEIMAQIRAHDFDQ